MPCIARSKNAYDTAPNMTHVQVGAKGSTHYGSRKLGGSVPIVRVAGEVRGQNAFDMPKLTLRPGTNEHGAAEFLRGFNRHKGEGDVPLLP